MRLSRALNDKKMDLRLRDKLVHEGKITKSQLNDFFKSLPDDATNATSVDEAQENHQAAAAPAGE
jgi:hypothetical protein